MNHGYSLNSFQIADTDQYHRTILYQLWSNLVLPNVKNIGHACILLFDSHWGLEYN